MAGQHHLMDCSNQVVREEECMLVGLGVVFRHFYDYWPEEECGVVGTIRKGIFGTVLLLLVEGRNTGSMFVMKRICKEYMIKKKEQSLPGDAAC